MLFVFTQTIVSKLLGVGVYFITWEAWTHKNPLDWTLVRTISLQIYWPINKTFFTISFGNFSLFFIQNGMPYFTLPFTLPTMVFINVNDTRGLLYRIEHYSFPEKQTSDWYKSKRVCIIYQFLQLWYRKPRKNVVEEL